MTGNDYEQLKQAGQQQRDAGIAVGKSFEMGDYVRIKASTFTATRLAIRRAQANGAILRVDSKTKLFNPLDAIFIYFQDREGANIIEGFEADELEPVDLNILTEAEMMGSDAPTTPEPDALHQAAIKRLEERIAELEAEIELHKQNYHEHVQVVNDALKSEGKQVMEALWRVDALEAALKPFADAAENDFVTRGQDDHSLLLERSRPYTEMLIPLGENDFLGVKHLRAAAEALKGGTP